MYSSFIKPVFDFIAALILLLISSPVLIITMLLLAMGNKGSVFFTQNRPGKNEELFKIIKLKTMTDKKAHDGDLLSDKERLTTIGKWVRRLSIDEIPQLINVVKGEMSLVGPRPLLVEYLPFYNKEQGRRHQVKPGITGWAQINGRNRLSWEEKFKMDVWYVDNLSPWLDLKIILLTFVKIIKVEGINSGTSSTMEKFTGSERSTS